MSLLNSTAVIEGATRVECPVNLVAEQVIPMNRSTESITSVGSEPMSVGSNSDVSLPASFSSMSISSLSSISRNSSFQSLDMYECDSCGCVVHFPCACVANCVIPEVIDDDLVSTLNPANLPPWVLYAQDKEHPKVVFSTRVVKLVCETGCDDCECTRAHGNAKGSNPKTPLWCLNGTIDTCVKKTCQWDHFRTEQELREYKSHSGSQNGSRKGSRVGSRNGSPNGSPAPSPKGSRIKRVPSKATLGSFM